MKPSPLPRRHLLASALALAVLAPAGGVMAADADSDTPQRNTRDLDAVVVTASPLKGSTESLAKPVEVLVGEELDRSKAATLGDTVAKLPGVQTTFFGTGVGRPIIRGQEGPRVQVLSGGIGSMDASTVSADHAVTIEPFLADQIEVLKGPATLLFGSGAIGGAVNVVDGRLPDTLPEDPFSGRMEVRGNTVNDERSGMFRLDGVNGDWVLHVDGLVRNTDDYDIPGYAILEHHEEGEEDHAHEEAQPKGTLPNSSVRTRAGAVGATWLGEKAYFGLAASTYRNNYGIPAGAHVHDDGHGHGHEGEEEEAHEEEGPVRIDMVQNRIDLKAGVYDPFSFLQAINLRGAYNDYEHVELEGGQPATRFTNRGRELRLEAVQKEFAGWRGAFGLQYGRSDFGAIGEEAFVPATVTDTLGVFVVQEKDFGPWKLELGGRHDQVKLDPAGHADRDFNVTSLSGAAIWRISPMFDLRFGLDSAERAPTNEELFAAGTHVATQSVEIGDANLDKERSRRAEIGLHAHTDRVEFKLAVYQTNFKDFIYLADTGIEEGLPVRLWTQQDAKFKGAEAEARIKLIDSDAAGAWDLRLFGDTVRAELDGSGTRNVQFDVPHGDHSHHYAVDLAQGGNLPRIAPTRFGANLDWSLGGWRASVGAVRYAKQDEVAQNEEPSPGYTLVDAHLAYRWDRPETSWEVFLDGSNLTDQEARPHTSLLRDFSPLPGRGVAFGIRAYF
ncbi:TonB-dependent receptor [Pseudoxanthomonas beigongshangi]